MMTETFRAFIAIDLPERVRSALGEAQKVLKLQGFRVKWVRPSSIHLTLKFLGSTAVADVDKIVAAMALAAQNCTPFSLAAKGIGVFPDIRRARVIWTGLTGGLETLQQMQQSLDGHLADQGFAPENRDFKAHLTLGRVKGKINSNHLKAALIELAGFESKPFDVSRMILFKSELRAGGAVYTQVQGVSL